MKEFKIRSTKPEAGNKYYITKSKGGYSVAIVGSPTDKDCNVLSNCVGYAYGRFNEIGGYGYCKYLYPTNAENFMQYRGDCEVGMTPKIGACMVWQRGATLSGSDGAGHVAIVEKVISDTEIITSESGWNSAAFWTQRRVKGNGNWGQNSAYKFLGFIYNPAVTDDTVAVGDIKPDRNPAVTNDRIDTVLEVQKWLNSSYNAGLATDGIYGPLTKKALIKVLQKAWNVDVDGIYGPQTNGAVELLRKGSTGEAVKALQGLLVCNKYTQAYVDGDFGAGTYNSVIDYQRKNGLGADGMAGQETFSALCE